MLIAEYDYDTDIAVQREESLRIGIQQGFSDGSYFCSWLVEIYL